MRDGADHVRVISASHLPAAVGDNGGQVIAEHDNVRVIAADLSPAQLDRVCSELARARVALADMPVRRVISAIDRTARRLLDTSGLERADVLHSLHAISGYSTPMATHMLDRAAADWLAPALEELLLAELGGADAVEDFVMRNGRHVRASAPALGLHVLAGNVPGVGVTSIVRALLVRSAVLAKSAVEEPALAAAFVRILTEVEPAIGACAAVTYWRGGDRALEDAVLARVGLVVHYGGADAIADLRARAPTHVRFVEHGPRISFAVIRAAATDLSAAGAALARAAAVFDQHGCVSPQLAYVIGTRDQAADVAAAAAHALAQLQLELPRGRIDAGEAAAIREMRTRAEFAAISGKGGELFAPHDLSYSVILSEDPTFEGTCLNRTLLIKAVPDFATLLGSVTPFRDVLQTVGLEGFSPQELRPAAAALADAGVTRITNIQDMPWPPPAWHHDGRGPLQELIRWVDLDV